LNKTQISLLIGNLVAATLSEEREEGNARELDAAADRFIRAKNQLERALVDQQRATPNLDWCLDQLRGMARHEQRIGEIRNADFIYSLVGRLRRAAKRAQPVGAEPPTSALLRSARAPHHPDAPAYLRRDTKPE